MKYIGNIYNYECEILKVLCNYYGIKISINEIEKYLIFHPSYPYLSAICDTLNFIGINFLPIEINRENLNSVSIPFLTYYNFNDNKRLTILIKISQNTFKYWNNTKKKWIIILIDEIIENCDSIILITEPSQNFNRQQDKYNFKIEKNIKVLKKIATIFCICLLTILLSFSDIINKHLNLFNILNIFINSVGAIILYFFIRIEKFNDKNLQSTFCKGENSNCSNIGKGKIEKFNISIIGISYFILGISVIFIDFVFNSAHINSFFLLSLFSPIIVIASLYYQTFINKHFCKICLLVISLLLFQFIISLIFFEFNPTNTSRLINYESIIAILITFIIIYTLILLYIKYLQTIAENKILKIKLLRFKNSKEIFKSLTSKIDFDKYSDIKYGLILGNSKAENTIIKICNPYCKPCSKSHRDIIELLKFENLKIIIIYNVTTNINDLRKEPVNLFFSIKNNEKYTNLLIKALNDWYEMPEKNFNKFKKKYDFVEISDYTLSIHKMYNICKKLNITHTPTYFVNGYKLPKGYEASDIKYLINIR